MSKQTTAADSTPPPAMLRGPEAFDTERTAKTSADTDISLLQPYSNEEPLDDHSRSQPPSRL